MQPRFSLISPRQAYASAREIVVQTLNRLGFALKAEQVPLHEADFRSELDFVFLRNAKEYAVEVKYSRKTQLVLMHLLPRAILLLQTAKRIRQFRPIVAIVVEDLAQQDVQRLAAQMEFYAPEVGWLLIDRNENVVFKDPEQKAPKILNRKKTEWQNSDLSKYHTLSKDDQVSLFDDYSVQAASYSQSLSFSDLEQWLLKVLLLSSVDAQCEYWGGPAGNISNAFQLSKLATVSPPVANSFVNVMELRGYLKRVGRKKLVLLRPDAILEEWREKYRFDDNRVFPYRSIYPVSDPRVYFEEILDEIRECNKQVGPVAVTGHQAAVWYGVGHSSARSIHLYFLGSRHHIANALNLVPSGTTDDADLFLLEPKYRQCVFRARLERDEIPVCDIFQCYLDLFHLPDRGQEQANLIYETIITRILTERKPYLT